MKQRITAKKTELGLSRVVGCSNVTYVSEPSGEHNMFELYVDHVLPDQQPIENGNHTGPDGKPKGTVYLVGNGGTFRSNIYEGVVTFDDLLSVQPWREPFDAIRNVHVDDLRVFYTPVSASVATFDDSNTSYSGVDSTFSDVPSQGYGKSKGVKRLGNQLVNNYYVSTVDNLDDYTYYDISANSYDIDTILNTLLLHNPTANYVREDLNNSDVEMLATYVEKYMPCPATPIVAPVKPGRAVAIAVSVSVSVATVAIAAAVAVVVCVAVRKVRRRREAQIRGDGGDGGGRERGVGTEEEESGSVREGATERSSLIRK